MVVGSAHENCSTRCSSGTAACLSTRTATHKLTIPLNDSLTNFRIVAVANGGTDLFGTGSTSIATTQDLLLLSGLPPVVREGDQYSATFTLRNTTDHLISADASVATSPTLVPPLAPQRFDIAAGGARDVVWNVTAPVGVDSLAWDVSLKATAGDAHDRLAVSQQIIPATPARTFQATLAQLDRPLVIAAQRPAGAIAGRGGLDVSLQARLGDRLDGVREYMASLSVHLSRTESIEGGRAARCADAGNAGWSACPPISIATGY